MLSRAPILLLAAFAGLAACGPKPAADDTGTGSTGAATTTSTTAVPTTGTDPDTTAAPTSTTDATTTTTATTTLATTGEPLPVIPCFGKIFDCGDGLDNDGDGLSDLADPECTGPCDSDEASFQKGLPGGNADPCKTDCFFDANNGAGDDGCRTDLGCDPLEPLGLACPFKPDCPGGVSDTPPECLDFCRPLTPNGCDCFGCCHIQTPDGPIDIYLEGSAECRVGNLEACTRCTFNAACENPCEPAACELCLGEQALPPGCAEPGCQGGVGCTIDAGISTCPAGMYCVTGCCMPQGGI